MPTNLSNVGRTEFAGVTIGAADIDNGVITGAKLTTAARAQRVDAPIPTVATTGAVEVLVHAPGASTLSLARIAFKDALASNNSNYITIAIVNKATGAGSNAMLAATDANTTKATGGTAISAYTSRTLTLNGTAGNLVVAAGDLLQITITATGTLANTLTLGTIKMVFDATV